MVKIKKTSSVFVLLFMVATLAVPLFSFEIVEDCCCGETCACESAAQMSCEMEITSCETFPVMPIPAAPFNQVKVEQPTDHQNLVTYGDPALESHTQTSSGVCINTGESPPNYHLPLLI